MMPIDFRRVHDHSYRFTIKNQVDLPQEVFLRLSGKINSESYETAQQISEYISSNKYNLLDKKKLFFEKNGRIFHLELVRTSKVVELAKSMAKFFKFFQNPSKIDVKISEISRKKKFKKTDLVVRLSPITKAETPRESISKNNYQTPAFSDGYSKIAAEAFQKYEPHFAPCDLTLSSNDHSHFRIVQNGSYLELVPAKNYSSDEKGLTLRNYRDFLINEFGKEKVDYVAYLYKIDLNAVAALTPEIVYRMNIGMGNIEKQDLDSLVSKLDGIAQKTHNEHIFNDAWLPTFTVHELRGIKRLCSKEGALTPRNITEWLRNYQNLSHGKRLKAAYSILCCQPEERICQFTGKDIVYPIKSTYTIGDRKHYKPWVDQQELLHIFAFMDQLFSEPKKTNIWDAYCELLTHLVCKKHLARRHPTDEFRVGAVIPAPPDKAGEKRWYVVTNCISNGKGIHSYTLEPLDAEDTTLPAIKLFRSTSRSSSALDYLSSIKNDFNPINSPGYEGAEFIKKYQDDFFKQRTIPLWVAYNVQAGKELDKSANEPPSQKMQENLLRSINAYKQHAESLGKPKEMKQIIHTRDAELIQLGCNLMRKSIFNFFKVCRLLVVMFRYRGQEVVPPQTQKKDMEFLLSLIKSEDVDSQGFKSDLEQRIYTDEETRKKLCEEEKLISHLLQLFHKGEFHILNKTLEDLAKKAGEHPAQKIKQAVILTGHSLGASCAQKFFVDYTAKAQRIPLEGMEMAVKCFDPPAINADDNGLFRSFGSNKALFHDLNVKFSITHRIEAGDFVSQGGGEHLGAAKNYSEQQELQEWAQFEASVSQGLKFSSVPEIRDPSVHATRFERGKRNPAFIVSCAKKLLKKGGLDKDTEARIVSLLKNRQGDYERTWVDPQILWRFDHGDKRTWKHIQSVWQEPGLFSSSVEKIRLFFGVLLRVVFAAISLNTPVEQLPDTGHGTWWKYRDANGVFAVELDKGISSKRGV